MKKISICIPTFNRHKSLRNCLNSIIENVGVDWEAVDICISDNCSEDQTEAVVLEAKKKIDIKYIKNETNLGRVQNYLNVVNMASGKFVWMIGDDDLILPHSLKSLIDLLDTYSHKVDFFYVNSYLLDSSFIFSSKQPFSTNSLSDDMKKFSPKINSELMNFMDLINPNVSFDFLGGMYLSVFKKKNWSNHTKVLNKEDLNNKLIFSTFGNTFPHVKIFANAFAKSKAYFCSTPLSVTLSGEREWQPMYPLIRSIRLIEALDEFRKHGLKLKKYYLFRNYALSYFAQDFVKMMLDKKNSGWKYFSFRSHVIHNLIYPNFYLSFFYFFLRRLKIMN